MSKLQKTLMVIIGAVMSACAPSLLLRITSISYIVYKFYLYLLSTENVVHEEKTVQPIITQDHEKLFINCLGTSKIADSVYIFHVILRQLGDNLVLWKIHHPPEIRPHLIKLYRTDTTLITPEVKDWSFLKDYAIGDPVDQRAVSRLFTGLVTESVISHVQGVYHSAELACGPF